MKRLLALAAALAVAVAVVAATTASGNANQAGSTTIRVNAKTTSFNQVGQGVGSIITFTDDLFQNGKKIGTDVVACIVTGPGDVQECYATDTLPKGQISSMGPSDPVTQPRFPVAITGGTGAYRDAWGTSDVNLIDQENSTYVYHVDGVLGG